MIWEDTPVKSLKKCVSKCFKMQKLGTSSLIVDVVHAVLPWAIVTVELLATYPPRKVNMHAKTFGTSSSIVNVVHAVLP